jgi:hypothetical protein
MSAVTSGRVGRAACRQASRQHGSVRADGGVVCGEQRLATLRHDTRALASSVTVRLRTVIC